MVTFFLCLKTLFHFGLPAIFKVVLLRGYGRAGGGPSPLSAAFAGLVSKTRQGLQRFIAIFAVGNKFLIPIYHVTPFQLIHSPSVAGVVI